MLKDAQLVRKAFGDRVRDLREGMDWSQPDLAFEAGLDPGTISKIELGKVNAGLESIVAIARAFKMSVSELMNY